MSKIDINTYINNIYTNKYNEKYKVLKYLFKEKTNHCFEIEFIDTKNIQMATLNQIRKGTTQDLVQRKKIKRLKTELDLRERNRLVKKAKETTQIPIDLPEKNVLAIDLSSKSTGLAYAVKGQIRRWKTISSEKSDFRERGLEIIGEIVKILEKGKIDIVILEDVYLGLNSKVLIVLAEIRGMLTYHIKRLKLELLIIPAVLWKNRIEGTPLHRQEQKEFMMNKFYELTGEKADTDDSADAYMMLKSCLTESKEGE